MPVQGARYRITHTRKGPVRLAFKGDKVVEAKNMKTGNLSTRLSSMISEGKFKKRKQ